MIEIFTLAGSIILGLLMFLLKFIGSLCLIALVLIVFVILFVVLVGGGWLIGQTLLEIASDKYSVFKKEVNDYEEGNNNNCDS